MLMRTLVFFRSICGAIETGFLADEGDYQTWIESIKSLLNNKELAEKLGNNARELLLEKFNWDVVAKKFVAAAESALEKRIQ